MDAGQEAYSPLLLALQILVQMVVPLPQLSLQQVLLLLLLLGEAYLPLYSVDPQQHLAELPWWAASFLVAFLGEVVSSPVVWEAQEQAGAGTC